MGAISAEGVKVFCDIPYMEIEEFKCTEKINEHTDIVIKLKISERTALWFDTHSLCGRKIKAELWREKKICGIIWGSIVSCELENIEHHFFVSLKAVSLTNEMDKEEKTCRFQRVGYPYQRFIEDMMGKYSGACILGGMFQQNIRYPIMQYRETDWNLLKRIAAQFDVGVIADAGSDVPKTFLGGSVLKEYILDSFDKIRQVNAKHQVHIHTWETYGLGDRIRIGQMRLEVKEKITVFRHGLIEYDYWAGPPGKEMGIAENERLRGISMRGTILEVRDEYVKLDFGRAEDQTEMDENFRYPYLPVTGNIMYSMPEKGSEAELYFPTADVKHAYVRNCFLPKKKYPRESTKFFHTCYGKGMAMEPGVILWIARTKQGQCQNMSLSDERGIYVSSHKAIVLEARGNINVCAGASCTMVGRTEVKVKQKGTPNTIHMSGNGIEMRSERYETAAADIGKKKERRPDNVPVVSEASFAEMKECAIAAIPNHGIQEGIAEQALAAIPKTLSGNIGNDVIMGDLGGRG